MRIDVGPLPDEPLAAAGVFHAEVLPRVQPLLGQNACVTLRFSPADHTHEGWRLAAVQELARAAAPNRVNAIAADDEAAIAAAVSFLEGSPGITGQMLPLDGEGAGHVL